MSFTSYTENTDNYTIPNYVSSRLSDSGGLRHESSRLLDNTDATIQSSDNKTLANSQNCIQENSVSGK